MSKSMWNSEAVKAYESGQGVVLVEKPYPHYEPKDGGWTQQRVAGMARLKEQQEAKLKERTSQVKTSIAWLMCFIRSSKPI